MVRFNKYYLFLCLSTLVLGGCSSSKLGTNEPTSLEVDVLKKAYPNHVLGYKNGKVLIANGTKIVFDDKKQKSHIQLINNADLQDMFVLKYQKGEMASTYAKNDDPGRYKTKNF